MPSSMAGEVNEKRTEIEWIDKSMINKSFVSILKVDSICPKTDAFISFVLNETDQFKVTLTWLLLFKLYYGINIRNLRTNRMYRMSKKSDLTNYISICEINAPNISV